LSKEQKKVKTTGPLQSPFKSLKGTIPNVNDRQARQQ